MKKRLLRAKKSYGQHFLTNEDIAMNIANALTLNGEKPKVLEVGPGQGFLTKYLLEKKIDLIVVEADRDMVDHLHLNYIQLHGKVISDDFLKLSLDKVFPKSQQQIQSEDAPSAVHRPPSAAPPILHHR